MLTCVPNMMYECDYFPTTRFFSRIWRLSIVSYFNLHFFNYDWDWVFFQRFKNTSFSFDVNSLFKSFASLCIGPSVLFWWDWRALYGIKKPTIYLPMCSICHFSGISPTCHLPCLYSSSFIIGSLDLSLLYNSWKLEMIMSWGRG